MKLGFLYASFLLYFPAVCQIQKSQELYQKIENYYTHNADKVDVIGQTFKSALGLDTSRSFSAYVKLPGNIFSLSYLDSAFSTNGCLLYSEKYYHIWKGIPEKIKIKQNELGGTAFNTLKFIPAYNANDLEQRFGEIQSYLKSKEQYLVFTSKYTLTIDTLTFRITGLTETIIWEGKLQYRKIVFTLPHDSIQTRLKEEAKEIMLASKDFSTKTFNQIKKKRVPVKNNEGKKFAFNNLISFNKGMLDPDLKNKYIILDFFYESCMPCHKMTGYILDWLPNVDSSKIVLIGVDPKDSESSMRLFVKERKIDYPIIIGQQAKDIVRYYKIHVYPTLFMLSPEGKIQIAHEGMSKTFLTKAEKIIPK